MVHLNFLTFCLANIPLLSAHPAEFHTDIHGRHFRGGCASHTTPKFLAAIAEVAALDTKEFSGLSDDGAKVVSLTGGPKTKLPKPPKPTHPLRIKTYMHIIAASKNLTDGWIPDSQLKAQLKVLNEDFAPHNISFELAKITRTINADWAVDAGITPENNAPELEMKKATRRGDYETLNLYFQKALKGGSLGYAYYPTNATKGSDEFWLDGATNRCDTIPGGTLTNYNLGKGATHEVGHWLGLIHTFEGFSCSGPGDLIADTPAQNLPTSGCPVGIDTCPNDEGVDPIHNYMDYSYDACYEEFTPLQRKRMYDLWKLYRE